MEKRGLDGQSVSSQARFLLHFPAHHFRGSFVVVQHRRSMRGYSHQHHFEIRPAPAEERLAGLLNCSRAIGQRQPWNQQRKPEKSLRRNFQKLVLPDPPFAPREIAVSLSSSRTLGYGAAFQTFAIKMAPASPSRTATWNTGNSWSPLRSRSRSKRIPMAGGMNQHSSPKS
jgi:hypothetical protein